MKKNYSSLLIFDMDGVLTQHSSSWQFVHDRIGVSNRENYELFKNRKISYEEFLESDVKLWNEKLGTVHKEDVVSILSEIPLRNNLEQAMNSLRKFNCVMAIVSGGISWLSDRVNNVFHFDYTYANRLYTDSRGVIQPKGLAAVDPLRKDITVRELQNLLGVEKKNTISVGDSIHDISMFIESGFSVAFNAADEDVEKNSTVSLKSNDLKKLAEIILEQCLLAS